MRTRRQFQPTLDELQSRIAPSAVGGLLAAVAPVTTSLPVVAITMDAATPPTTDGSPTVLSPPTPATNPGLC